MATNKVLAGLKLYREGKVKLKFKDEELIQFEIQGTPRKGKPVNYQVARYLDNWICDCEDYMFRYKKEPGSYECKHIRAANFKLAEILLGPVSVVPGAPVQVVG